MRGYSQKTKIIKYKKNHVAKKRGFARGRRGGRGGDDAKAQQSNRMGAPGPPAHSGTAATSKQAPEQLDKHPYSKTSARIVRQAPVQ